MIESLINQDGINSSVKISVFHFIFFENCNNILNRDISNGKIKNAVNKAIIYTPTAKRLSEDNPVLEHCLQDLIEASGINNIAALKAFLKELGIANNPIIRELLLRHQGELTEADLETFEEKIAASRLDPRLCPVVSIALSSAEKIKGGECNVRIRCYAAGGQSALLSDAIAEGVRVNPRDYISKNLLPALNHLAEASGDGQKIRIEFVVPTERLGDDYDQWTFQDRGGQERPIGRRYPVVVRWEENAKNRSVDAMIHRRIKSAGVKWLPDPLNAACPFVCDLLEQFDLADADDAPAPASLLVCETSVAFKPDYWAKVAYLGVAALWIRAASEVERVRETVETWLDEVKPAAGVPEETRHFALPGFAYRKRTRPARENPWRDQVHLLWENPNHFVTPEEYSATDSEQRQRVPELQLTS